MLLYSKSNGLRIAPDTPTFMRAFPAGNENSDGFCCYSAILSVCLCRNMDRLIDKLRRERKLQAGEYALLLEQAGSGDAYAARAAREVTQQRFGRGVFIRGLIEITSHCRNDCYYCGLRRSNSAVARYRLSQEQIMACCQYGYMLGFRTFVLQGGEDPALDGPWMQGLVRSLRAAFPDCALTLSLGERRGETYRRWREAGADRYLLRHEAADAACYARLHPPVMTRTSRLACLQALRESGYQTGAGMMVGAPGQTTDDLIADLLFIERFRPEMIGVGPYLPQRDTPLAGSPAGSAELTLLLLSILRLMLPDALIPATTALASLLPQGRVRGILAGANVVMPNLSPPSVRGRYAIYDGKLASDAEAAEGLLLLERELDGIGYRIDYGRGDYRAVKETE